MFIPFFALGFLAWGLVTEVPAIKPKPQGTYYRSRFTWRDPGNESPLCGIAPGASRLPVSRNTGS